MTRRGVPILACGHRLWTNRHCVNRDCERFTDACPRHGWALLSGKARQEAECSIVTIAKRDAAKA